MDTVQPYCLQQLHTARFSLSCSHCLVSLFYRCELDSHKQPWLCLGFFFETAVITEFRLGKNGTEADRSRDTNRKPRWCQVCQMLWYLSKLWWDWDKKKKLDPIHSVALPSFLWLVPMCLSTAELLATSNQCVHCLHCSLLFFFTARPTLSLPLSFLPDRSDIRNLYYQVFPGCWWKSWFATPDWIYLSFIPFQPPASCPSRQEPNGLSTVRCQGIKISICRNRGREGGRKETERGERRERDGVGRHVTALDSLGDRQGRGDKCTPCLFPSRPQLHPLCKPLSTSIIHPFISQQTKLVRAPPPWSPPPHTTHTSKVQSLSDEKLN